MIRLPISFAKRQADIGEHILLGTHLNLARNDSQQGNHRDLRRM